MTYLCTKFLSPIFSGSLVIAVGGKTRHKFARPPCWYFTLYNSITLEVLLSETVLPFMCQGLKVTVALIIQVPASAVFLSLTVGGRKLRRWRVHGLRNVI